MNHSPQRTKLFINRQSEPQIPTVSLTDNTTIISTPIKHHNPITNEKVENTLKVNSYTTYGNPIKRPKLLIKIANFSCKY